VFRLKLLDGAYDDLESILRYITLQSGSEATGTAFVLRLLDKCADLAAAEFKLGRLRPELGPELRSLPFGNYILFFRYREGWLEVVNIPEGHRDIGDHFPSESSDTYPPASPFHITTTAQCINTAGQIEPERRQLIVQARPSAAVMVRKAGSAKTGWAIGRPSHSWAGCQKTKSARAAPARHRPRRPASRTRNTISSPSAGMMMAIRARPISPGQSVIDANVNRCALEPAMSAKTVKTVSRDRDSSQAGRAGRVRNANVASAKRLDAVPHVFIMRARITHHPFPEETSDECS